MSQVKKKVAVTPSNDLAARTSKEECEDKNLKIDEKKVGWCRQKFRDDWCTESEFEGWLEEVPDDPFRAWCRCCQCTLLVGRSELLKHSTTKKHKRAFQECKISNPMMSLVDGKLLETSSQGVSVATKMVDEGLLRAELRVASYAVDHNLSANAVEHLGSLINVLNERIDILPKLKMNLSKCSTIVSQVLMKSVEQDLEELLKANGYSVMIEEAEISDPGRRAFVVIVKYYNETRNKTWNQLLGTLIVTDQDLIAKSLWKMAYNLLANLKAPVTNLTAIAADSASPLYNHLCLSELNKINDNLQLFRFDSRSMLTVVWSAVNTLPEGLETLMLHFGSLVTGQLKHVYHPTPEDLLPALQEVTSYDTRKHFQSISSPEWLINSNCTGILAQALPLLISFLEKRLLESGSGMAEALIQEATNPYTKAYFLFLSYILTHFDSMHNLLRPASVNSYQLVNDFMAQFRVLCQHFLAPAVFMVSDLNKIDLEDEKNLLPEKSIFVGSECQEYLKMLDTTEQTEQFMGQCRRFLQVAAIQIKNRIPMNDLVLNLLTFLDPDVAFRNETRLAIPSLQPLGLKYPVLLNCSKLDEQWLALPTYFSASDVEELKRLPVDTMWGVISDMRNSNDVLVFGALGRLAKIMLSLPTPDADVVTLTKMVSEVTRGCYSDEQMKAKLDLIPLRHALLMSNTECYQQRVTMKNRKLYMLNVNKKDDFLEDNCVFASDSR